MTSQEIQLDDTDKRLLNDYQRDFPTCSQPFAQLAKDLALNEDEVIARLQRLQGLGVISRVGPVFTPKRIGASTLAAMQVPDNALEQTIALVNSYPEVNHNYLREHEFNLWFVVTAADQARLQAILLEIEQVSAIQVLDLPMEKSYHIDLGFPLWQ